MQKHSLEQNLEPLIPIHENALALERSTQHLVETAAAIIYPDSAVARGVKKQWGEEPTILHWRNQAKLQWQKNFIGLVKTLDFEYGVLQLHASQGSTDTLWLGYLNQVADTSGTLWQEQNVGEPLLSLDQLIQLKLAKLYAQHRTLQITGKEFCNRPALRHPAQAHYYAGSTITNSWPALERLNRKSSRIHDSDYTLAQAELHNEDLTGILNNPTSQHAVSESLMRILGIDFSIAEAATEDAVLSARIQEMSAPEVFNIPASKLQDYFAELPSLDATTDQHQKEALLLSNIYIAAIEEELLSLQTENGSTSRIGRLLVNAASTFALIRSRSIGRSVVRSLGKNPSLHS